MNDQEMREILMGFLPGPRSCSSARTARRMVLAVDGPADGLIEIYRRQGYLIEARAGLRKAS